MVKNKTLINIHARNYIAAVFEKRLREEGFTCPDDKLLCWYRVRNQEVLDTIMFCSKWPNTPLSLDIYYETVPLFMNPIRINNVHYNTNGFDRWDCRERRGICEGESIDAVTFAPYSDSILVYAPTSGRRGLYTLNEVILPYMDQINTVYDCYLAHKQKHEKSDTPNKYWNMSKDFIDEVLFADDRELYAYCEACVERTLRTIADLVYLKSKNQSLLAIQEQWQQLKTALSPNGRDSYIDILAQREIRNVAFLSQKMKIKIY